MKKRVILFWALCLMLALAACAGSELAEEVTEPLEIPKLVEMEPLIELSELPFEGKIAIITQTESNLAYSSFPLKAKYGDGKVIGKLWPISYPLEDKSTIAIFAELEQDPDLKVVIANPLIWSGNPFFEKLQETRDDIFVIYCDPQMDSGDSWEKIAKTADLILQFDEIGIGPAMVQQAQKLGAKTFVHYSFPRYMDQQLYSERRNLMKAKCEELDIWFVDTTVIEPGSGADPSGAQQFILDDVPKMVEKYGKDTAFFATPCSLQTSLRTAVEVSGAISPQPCHPLHLRGVPVELDYHIDYWLGQKIGGDRWWNNLEKWWVDDTHSLIDEYNECLIEYRRTNLAEKDMLGRFSNWPVDYEFMFTYIAAEYAIKWINGEVPKEGVDVEVLKQMMEDYAGVEVYLTPFVDDGIYDLENSSEPSGETYENFLLVRMDYITY